MSDYRGITKNFFTSGWDTREISLAHLRERYARTKDVMTLQEIIALQDFPEAKQAAKELGKNYIDKKVFRDVKWREIDRMYTFFTPDKMTKTEFYDFILEQYYPDEPDKGVQEIVEAHKNWAAKAFNSLSKEEQQKIRKTL